MSQIVTFNIGVETESDPVIRLRNVRDVTKRKKPSDRKQLQSLDEIVKQSEGHWVSHEDLKRRLGL